MQKRFDILVNDLKSTSLWRDMLNTREASPWHREANVAVHTEMLLDWYKKNLYSARSPTQRLFTMVACLFHDTGKPAAKVAKHSETRGDYFAFHGHEQLSARIWMDYALSNPAMIKDVLRFTQDDVANISLMLEYHVPWSMKDKRKRSSLKESFMVRMGERGHQAWLDFLLSDQHGRFSDAKDVNIAEIDKWMKDWETV
jgi:CRISPR/Cas system-associated endonuclease Cas3-HD